MSWPLRDADGKVALPKKQPTSKLKSIPAFVNLFGPAKPGIEPGTLRLNDEQTNEQARRLPCQVYNTNTLTCILCDIALLLNNVPWYKVLKRGHNWVHFAHRLYAGTVNCLNQIIGSKHTMLSQCDDNLFGSKMHVLHNRMMSSLYQRIVYCYLQFKLTIRLKEFFEPIVLWKKKRRVFSVEKHFLQKTIFEKR